MTKYSKGIKIFKLNILVTDKNSFAECDKEILKKLNEFPDLSETDKKMIMEICA